MDTIRILPYLITDQRGGEHRILASSRQSAAKRFARRNPGVLIASTVCLHAEFVNGSAV